MVDPGFPRQGRQPNRKEGMKAGSVNLLFGQIFLKLHENEGNWTERAESTKIFNVDPPLLSNKAKSLVMS